MQMDSKEPATVAAAGGKPPTICNRLQRAFHARPAFRPLRRLTGRPQDGGAPGAATPAATGAPGGAPARTTATHGGAPPPVLLPARTPAPSPVGKAPAPTAPAPKQAAARGGGKPGQVPASTPTVTATTATTSNVAEKAAGGMPVPVPPSGVMTGRPPADAKAGDKAQQTKGKTRVGSRVRKALTSSK